MLIQRISFDSSEVLDFLDLGPCELDYQRQQCSSMSVASKSSFPFATVGFVGHDRLSSASILNYLQLEDVVSRTTRQV